MGHLVSYEIRNGSIEKYEKRVFLRRTLETVDAYCTWDFRLRLRVCYLRAHLRNRAPL
jgi:hypothetical protein